MKPGKANGKPAAKPNGKPKPKPPPPTVVADSPNWYNLLVRTKRNEIASTAGNIILALSQDPEWKDVLGLNTFIGDIEAMRPPPWRGDLAPGIDPSGRAGPRYWTDQDTTRCGAWLARKHKIIAPDWVVGSGLQVFAEQRKFHPVRDWLSGLVWDGEERLNSWLIRHAGAADDHYTRSVTAKWMIGLVARAFEPGCMFRMMIILEGAQDIRKSTALRVLAKQEEWFLETTIEMGSKDSYQTLRGKWIVEFAELDSLSRSETSRVKQYVSERVSTYRPSYGRRSIDFFRQCGFAGSTNDSTYLKDDTGATRFYPVKITRSIDVESLTEERDQLWAEAVVRYKKGELPFISDPTIRAAAAKVAEARRHADPWEDPTHRWLTRLPPRRADEGVTTYEVLTQALTKEAATLTRGDEMRVAAVLRACGWEVAGRPRDGDTRRRLYRPMENPLKLVGPPGPKTDQEKPVSSVNMTQVQPVQLVQVGSPIRTPSTKTIKR
jgi:putative DNA primase/helicase